ncbi:MAG: HAD family hydrolase [Oscillospiraceae bacterium]|nr:HAD family hydrolase [Oscillospiraceae bacterium]
MSIKAILWDYDGTIMDSSRKSIEVSLEVLSAFIPDIYENVPKPLSSRENFQETYGRISDWVELYHTCYGLNDEQTREAVKMWGKVQLKNKTEAELYSGIAEVLENFKNVKMGVCSQNGAGIIKRSLEHHGVLKYFGAVIGVDDVFFDEQKPHPAAFINCLDLLGIDDRNGTFVYIGDHSVDVAFGRNAEAALKKDFPDARVVCVAMHHPGDYCEEDENFMPDHVAKSSSELLRILNGI